MAHTFWTTISQLWRRKRFRRTAFIASMVLIPIGLFAYLTNPFVRFSLIVETHPVTVDQSGQLQLQSNQSLQVRDSAVWYNLAQVKSLWHFLSNKFSGGERTKSYTVDEIIAQIHQARFDPNRPFLISGEHFSMLYPRSLGIFYHSLLDPRTSLNQENWQYRQYIYAKTLSYALSIYEQTDKLSTTIVPIAPQSVVLVDFHAYPSDTLYSLLYAIDILNSSDFLLVNYPTESRPFDSSSTTQNTQQLVRQLLTEYRSTLQRHWQTYFEYVYDPVTGLVKTDVVLSGTKDTTRRQSAFYDNVVLWRTHQLAEKLGVITPDPIFRNELKQRVLERFWQPDRGIFIEDLSAESQAEGWYSSDWLIVLLTGFLDPLDEVESEYYQQSIDYIQRNALDQPFGLQFHPDLRRDRQFWHLRIFGPEYGSRAIWSNWGMEYIKALALTYQQTNNRSYLEAAQRQLEAYTFNIKRYQGYPEVYAPDGDIYRNLVYQAVRKTGWVVSYQQAQLLVESVQDI